MARRITSVFLCLVIAAAAFAGGSQETGTQGGGIEDLPIETEPNTLPIVEPGTYTMTIAHEDTFYNDTSYTDGLPVWEAISDRTGIDFNWEVHPGPQANVNLQIRLASGQNLPELMQLPGTVGDAVRYASDGLIVPMDDLIQAYGPNIQDLFREVPDIRRGLVAPDGEIYFLANYITGLPNGYGVVIRRDFLNQVGEDVPETPGEWLQVLRAFKRADLNGEGAGDVIPYGGHLGYFLSGFGMVSSNFGEFNPSNTYYWHDENGEIYYFALHPRFREFLEFANTLYEEELLDPMFGAGESMINTLRQQNKVAVYSGWPGAQDNHDAQLARLGFTEADHFFVPAPRDDSGASRFEVLNYLRNTRRWGITRDANDARVVMKFLDYTYASTEGTRYLQSGFEGDQYDIVDGQLVFRDEMFNNPNFNIVALLRQLGAFESYMDSQPAEFNEARLRGKFRETLELLNDSGSATRLPVIIPTIDEQERIVNLSQDINSYIDEATILFVTGRKPLSEFDQFVEELYDMGIEDLIDVYQAQFDRYTNS